MARIDPLVQSLLEIQEEPFVLIDRDCRIVAANKAYVDAYTDGSPVIGRTCHEISHHSSSPCHLHGEDCPLQLVLATGAACEVVHVHFNRQDSPERVRLTGYPIRSPDGRLLLGERIHRLDTRLRGNTPAQMVGSSQSFLNALGQLAHVAAADVSVLLSGESGVGKELAAHFLHGQSARKEQPFFAIDCATFSEPLFESELFGHERGAFTGCVGRKKGLYELAHGGILFLDEIGDIPYRLQAKLLRVLETGQFRRVGGNDLITVDVRVISASNRNLRALVAAGQFRRDLYYRITGIEIALPPLRQRRKDIPALAEEILDRICVRGARKARLTQAALEKLGAYDYPGNIRELRNILLKSVCLAGTATIDAHHIATAGHCKDERTDSPALASSRGEAEQIAELLELHNGHRATVARLMGISERTLYRKLRLIGASG